MKKPFYAQDFTKGQIFKLEKNYYQGWNYWFYDNFIFWRRGRELNNSYLIYFFCNFRNHTFAEKIAILLNIPEVIIGLTIIAIGTSLPELAATISAVLKNKTDMVVGNVIGSNVLNITLVVPIIGLFSNAQLDQMLFERDYLIMIVLSILFTIFAIRFMNTASINFIRLIGFLLVFGYIGYILRLSGLA